MSAKKTSRKKQDFKYSNVVDLNIHQKRSSVDLLPKNQNQEEYILNLLDPNKHIVFGVGPAGSGKTYLSVLAAIKYFQDGWVDRIIITRPAVALEEDLGFLPGTLDQKMAPWTRPIFDTLRLYFNANDIQSMLLEGVIEISPLAYMGGRNFVNSFIIADEMQLSTMRQQKMLLTRIASGSKMAITGDFAQASDKNNGLFDFIDRLKQRGSNSISLVEFTHNDIERHPTVREVLNIYHATE